MSAATVVSGETFAVLRPPQAGVQPPESRTKARLKSFSPEPLTIAESACGLLSSGMKYTGCRKSPFGGGGGGEEGLLLGDELGELLGDEDGELLGVVLGLDDAEEEGDDEVGGGLPPGPDSTRSSA